MRYTITNGKFHNEYIAFGKGNLPCIEVPIADDAEEVIIPDGVTEVYEMVFLNCTSLRRVIVPEGVRLIAEEAFKGCTNLREVVLPDSVEVICHDAFTGCTSLEQLHISNQLQSIHGNAFMGCSSLRSFDIAPDHPHFAFENGMLIRKENQSILFALPSLRCAVIPEGVKEIDHNAFHGCTQLERVTLPRSLEQLSPAFEGCEHLREFIVAPEHPYFAFEDGLLIQKARPEQHLSAEEAELFSKFAAFIPSDDVPELILALPSLHSLSISKEIKQIGNSAFKNCRQLKHIDLPEGLHTIGGNAFKNCSALAHITLPDSLQEIWANAFEGCTALSEITIPAGVKSLQGTFENCSALRRVTLSEGIHTLSMGVFSGCTALEEIHLPMSLQNISADSFHGCTALKHIALSENHPCFYFQENLLLSRADCAPHHPLGAIPAVTLRYHAQQESCVILALPAAIHAVVPHGVKRVGYEAFAHCPQLESVGLPDSLTEIRSLAFKGCGRLTRIDLPDGLRTLRMGVFVGCSALDHVNIPDSVTTIETSLFSGCTSLTDVHLPAAMTELPPATFSGCTALVRVTLPEGVKKIENHAFSRCTSLEKVSMSKGVRIEPLAFDGCPKSIGTYRRRARSQNTF